MSTEQTAQAIWQAHQRGDFFPQDWRGKLDLPTAYQVQLSLLDRKVAAGEWRDYALDLGRERAVFSVFRRSSECPLYRIEKSPKLARKRTGLA